jgi:hypothetical protein
MAGGGWLSSCRMNTDIEMYVCTTRSLICQWYQFTPCICAYLHKTAGHLKNLTKGTDITYTVKVIHVDNDGLNDDLDRSLFVS